MIADVLHEDILARSKKEAKAGPTCRPMPLSPSMEEGSGKIDKQSHHIPRLDAKSKMSEYRHINDILKDFPRGELTLL